MRSSTTSFRPAESFVRGSQLSSFMIHLEKESGTRFLDYRQFERFAIEHCRQFWSCFFDWSNVEYEGSLDPVCVGDSCESAVFFPNVRLSYAEMILGGGNLDEPALTAINGDGRREELTRRDLSGSVVALCDGLLAIGVAPGQRVVAIARSNAEVIVAALATSAVGATFSSCGPDMGASSILSRFAQLEPTVLFANVRSQPWDRDASLARRVELVAAGLTSLVAIVLLDDEAIEVATPVHRFSDLVARSAEPHRPWQRHPFNHPLFIMFSSGTTDAPKCIIHGAGGTILEHLKEHRLHCDLRVGDTLFFHTSCAWMMWNWQLSALASGAQIIVYDGPIASPQSLWRIVGETGVTVFGTSPAYLQACIAANYSPARDHDFHSLRGILSTGSVLSDRCYDWVGANVKDLPLQSISGGTDIMGCFVLGNPNLPVVRGEAQCRSLGLDVRSSASGGWSTAGSVGELICANPFPSRPLGFHGDARGRAFHRAYFSQRPDVWTHGDLIEFTASGGARLHGRSDAVLNIDGNRVGPAEIYRILATIDEIVVAAAVEQAHGREPGRSRLVLLLVLRLGKALDGKLEARIRAELAERGAASFVPAKIMQVDELPTTYNGKCSEIAVRDAISGRVPSNKEALRNPECLAAISRLFGA